ncbi:hypothetical protein Poly30_32760 [Planctomycetes bacterium Poly30]|uniref:ChrR Cupin-like domain protein n=1 Tax=Saltatorellus ferox TaxID=2528018 RepID=A0A518EUG0_9BACT|nr:hypothetical protein Poly30_32760 [Planctomycetes bacterium Poly30]
MLEKFQPLLDAAHGIDLSDPAAAKAALHARLDPNSPEGQAVSAGLVELLEKGEVANCGEAPVKFSRAAKATGETRDFSIDVVDMTGPGPRHLHPNGEINWCVALEGEPTFQGQPPGWVVETPGSEHVPTVVGGRMLIVYLLPGGAMQFL